MNATASYNIFPLGDSALLIDYGNEMNLAINKKILHQFRVLKEAKLFFITDIVPGYSSLAVHYNVALLHFKKTADNTVFETAMALISPYLSNNNEQQENTRLIKLPVCYQQPFCLDMDTVAMQKKIDPEEIINLHVAETYRVYMLGFLPGFAYMGQVNDQIAIPRKPQPRAAVPAGSVGIAGGQTGIYPLTSPGGWQIIGRTPVPLFNKEQNNPTLLQPGDTVQFFSITANEFADYQSRPA
ncbi:MAG: 5-oxoprolinase subunit PxpB [Bacteroidota bacterium]